MPADWRAPLDALAALAGVGPPASQGDIRFARPSTRSRSLASVRFVPPFEGGTARTE
jgi:hypothetical protein